MGPAAGRGRPWLATATGKRQGEACGAPTILLGCALSSRASPPYAVQCGDHDRGQRTRVAQVFVLRGGEEREVRREKGIVDHRATSPARWARLYSGRQ